jgi:hypothetical protein
MSVSKQGQTGVKEKSVKIKALLVIMALTAVMFSGCAKRGESVLAKSNDDFRVTLIFEVDGVKVYRFHDVGYYHYLAVRNTAEILESAYIGSTGKAAYLYYAGTIPEAVE